MLVFYAAGFGLLLTVRATPPLPRAEDAPSVGGQVVEAVRMIRTNRALWAALTVTVSLNFFGFPYLQMVPVIAYDHLGVGSALYGVLAAAAGLGSLFGALFIASRTVRNQGAVYSLGASLMLASVFLFAYSPWFPLSFALLVVSGVGMAGFATMQPAIALQAVPPEMRGRAMGAVALGIGASPVGMFLVGQIAEMTDPRLAVAVLAGCGFVVLTALRVALPELRRAGAAR